MTRYLKKCSLRIVYILFLILCLSFSFFLMSCSVYKVEQESAGAYKNISKRNKVILDKKLSALKKYEKSFIGEFGDWHEKMVKSGLARTYKDFDIHTKIVKNIMEKVGATYGYVLYSLDKTSEIFEITVDASKDPDSFGTAYSHMKYFDLALNGESVYDYDSFLDEYLNKRLWAFAVPIKNSAGEVVAIAGFDFDFGF